MIAMLSRSERIVALSPITPLMRPRPLAAGGLNSESSFCRRWLSAINRLRSRAMKRWSTTVWPIRFATMVRKRTSLSKRKSKRPSQTRSIVKVPTTVVAARIGTPIKEIVELSSVFSAAT